MSKDAPPVCLGVDHFKYLLTFSGKDVLLRIEGSDEPVRYKKDGIFYLSLTYTLPGEFQSGR